RCRPTFPAGEIRAQRELRDRSGSMLPSTCLPSSISFLFVVFFEFHHSEGRCLAHLLHGFSARLHQILGSIGYPSISALLSGFEMTLVSFLCRNHLRLQHVSHASFEPAHAGYLEGIVVVIFTALVDNVCLAIFTAALDNGDAFDELVHDVLPIVG